MKADFPDEGVYVSDGYAEKYNIKTGDTIWLKETYEDKTYSFAVKGIYVYPSGLSVFMSMPRSAVCLRNPTRILMAISQTKRSPISKKHTLLPRSHRTT